MLRKWWGGLGGLGWGWWRFFYLHTCDMLRTWRFLHLHACHMWHATDWRFLACARMLLLHATQVMGRVRGVGWGWWRFFYLHTCDMLRTWRILHLHTYDMLRTCTHVTCYRKLPQVCFRHANASKNLCGKLKTPQRPSMNKKKGWPTASAQSSEVPKPW